MAFCAGNMSVLPVGLVVYWATVTYLQNSDRYNPRDNLRSSWKVLQEQKQTLINMLPRSQILDYCWQMYKRILLVQWNESVTDISVPCCGSQSVIYFFAVNTHNSQAMCVHIYNLNYTTLHFEIFFFRWVPKNMLLNHFFTLIPEMTSIFINHVRFLHKIGVYVLQLLLI
jgi:hypothetical protein